MICVGGIDVGSFNTTNYIAWLIEKEFLLDLYIPTIEHPLPAQPSDMPKPKYIALDAP
ncbi:MAG: hypothetical protein GY941_03880, partial [Planctomycetes bacterium]|nr:hypothetical protein [Planctomycetota bacterium]